MFLAYDSDGATEAPATEGAFNPPAYDVATKLPSYDEAEKSKAQEAGITIPEQPVCPDMAARQERRRNGFLFWVSLN